MINIKAVGLYSSDFSSGETRLGDAQVITDGTYFDVIDGYCDKGATRLIADLKARSIKKPYLHISHPHYDHRDGINKILSDSYFSPSALYCQDPNTLTAHNASIRNDINALKNIIQKAKSKGVPVIYLSNNQQVQHGDVKFTVYRAFPSYNGNSEEYLNEGSLCYWFPETRYLTTGDASLWCAYKYNLNPLIIKCGHHGNDASAGDWLTPSKMCVWLFNRGCRFYWDNDFSTRLTDFLMTGREDAQNAGMIILNIHSDIIMTFAKGKATLRNGGNTYTAEVPYDGEMMDGKWCKGSNGWWYQYADGTYAIGWAFLKWSGGENWFYFNDEGYMMTGWHKLKWSGGTDWFLFSPEGVMLTGWQLADWSGGKNWFYFDPKTGAMQTGWIFVDGSWYYLDPKTGAMKTGWMDWKGRRCYLEPSVGRNQGHCYINCTATIDGITYRFDKDGYATEISGGKSCLHGVDIASYQSTINPAKLITTDFVIVKFTQGTSYLNPHADRQYSTAKSAGKLLGAYHYAEGKDAKAEAGHFVRSLGSRVGECILALDWEGNQNSKFGSGQDVAWCRAFLDEVHRLTGIRALIYMSKSVCRKYDWSSVAQNYPLWCAQYKTNTITDYQPSPWTDDKGFGAWGRDTIRQYSSHGRIAGYDANIDLDLAYLSADQWRAMASGKPQESPIDVLLSIAEAEVGTHEGANNSTKYGDEMHALQPRNMDKNAAWCDAFVDWCILKTCQHFGKGADTARMVLCGDFDDYTYASVNLYKKAGRWSQTPHRGDQIFFGGSGHTGIVTFVGSGVIKTIEGNKGDEVRRCSYSTSSPSIIGYGRPQFDLITGTVTAADMPLIKKGSSGEAVRKLQRLLNAAGASLEEDGSFGPATDAAVRAYQKAHGLEVDGEVGPMTWGKLLS